MKYDPIFLTIALLNLSTFCFHLVSSSDLKNSLENIVLVLCDNFEVYLTFSLYFFHMVMVVVVVLR